jgi:transposase-like protein
MDEFDVIYFECPNCSAFNGHIQKDDPRYKCQCGELITVVQYSTETINRHEKPKWFKYYLEQDLKNMDADNEPDITR